MVQIDEVAGSDEPPVEQSEAALEPGDTSRREPLSLSGHGEGGDVTEAVTSGPVPVYVCRVALVLLKLPEDAEPLFTSPAARALSADVSGKLVAALEAEPRVMEVLARDEEAEIDNARTHSFAEMHPHEDSLIDALKTRQVLRLNELLRFRVRVPIKNQPKYRSMDDVPSDEYLVYWDGVSAIVQWGQEAPRATASGGHVALDILVDVAHAAGYEATVMACSPGCHHRFVHTDLVAFASDDVPDALQRTGRTPVGSTLVVPFRRREDDIENLDRVYAGIHSAINAFAETQDLADELRFLEDRTRRDSAEILQITYGQVARRRLPDLRGWIVDLWYLKGSRRRKRQLIAGLWLALAVMDARVRQWQYLNARFRGLLAERKLGELGVDLDTREEQIRSLDLGLVRASLEETATRMEGRMMLIAGFAGAVAALAGAALAALLT